MDEKIFHAAREYERKHNTWSEPWSGFLKTKMEDAFMAGVEYARTNKII